MALRNEKREYDFNRIEQLLMKPELKYLTRTGIYIFPLRPKFYLSLLILIITYLIMFFGLFLFGMTILKSKGDVLLICETIVYLSIIIPVITILPSVIVKREYLRKLLNNASEGIFEYEDLGDEIKQLRKKGEEKTEFVVRLYERCVAAGLLSYLVVSPLLDYINLNSRENKNPDIGYALPASIWFPINSNNYTHGYILSFLYCATLGYIVFQLVIGYDSLFVFLCIKVATELKILTYSVERLRHRAVNAYIKSTNLISNEQLNNGPVREYFIQKNENDINKYVKRCLKENMDHYNAIQEFFHLTEDFFSIGLLLAVGFIMISLCTTLFLLSKLSPLSNVFPKFTSFLVCELIHTWFYCWFGHLITTESENFHDSLYKCEWITFTEPIKRSIRILQIVTLKPLTLFMVGVFPLNVDTLVQILQNTYSLYNLLLKTNS